MSVLYVRDANGDLVPVYTIKGDKGDKGDRGDKGDKGDKGDTYTLTAADKSTIVSAVISALPIYNGEVEDV